MSAAPKYMAVQGAALIVAVLVAVIGALGFIPGVTAHFDQFSWAGHTSGAELFGVFAVSGVVNSVHIVVGLMGIALARTYAGARAYLLGGGALYLGLWLYGVLVDHSSALVVPLNAATNWLHLVLGVVMALLAVTLAGQHDPTKRRRRVRTAT